jgi:N-acetylglucosaminyldiphosphoundecaprenol N-acetyl-beta-D-mannosaminyltransferase
MNEIKMLGCRMHIATMQETIDLIHCRIKSGKFTQHVVVNVAKLINMRTDEELRRSVNDCEIINIDGMGIVYGAKFLGYPVKERVTGIDLFIELVKVAEQESYPIFLLGAKEFVVEKTVKVLKLKNPKLKIAGYHHGYFWEDEERVVNEIASSGAKLLFVAITSPKKENFINKWKENLNIDFVMGVGGSFDVIAGEVNRAPRWMQNNGLEWFYRVLQEPRRLWKRYFITNTKFLYLILREKFLKKG